MIFALSQTCNERNERTENSLIIILNLKESERKREIVAEFLTIVSDFEV
jgi:hypothetical protein